MIFFVDASIDEILEEMSMPITSGAGQGKGYVNPLTGQYKSRTGRCCDLIRKLS